MASHPILHSFIQRFQFLRGQTVHRVNQKCRRFAQENLVILAQCIIGQFTQINIFLFSQEIFHLLIRLNFFFGFLNYLLPWKRQASLGLILI